MSSLLGLSARGFRRWSLSFVLFPELKGFQNVEKNRSPDKDEL
jgi:hypothetical protein